MYIFLFISYFVDGGISWLDGDPFTEDLGKIFYGRILGPLNAPEIFYAGAAFGTMLIRGPSEFKKWKRDGLIPVMLLGSSFVLWAIIAGIIGSNSGGQFKYILLQSRYYHNLPITIFVGFTLFGTKQRLFKFYKVIALAITCKAWQSIYVYNALIAWDEDHQYLIDHGYSIYCTLAVSFTICYFRFFKVNAGLKAYLIISLAPIAWSYVLNDRRTSLLATIIAIVGLVMMKFPKVDKKTIKNIGKFAIGVLALVAITWKLPAPLGLEKILTDMGFIGGPSGYATYRDLENANIFATVAESGILGFGSGKEIIEPYTLPDIRFIYEEYLLMPHNQLMTSWAFFGCQMAASMGMFFMISVWLCTLCIRHADAYTRSVGIIALMYFVQYLAATFADLGFQLPKNIIVAGISMGALVRIVHTNGLIRTDKTPPPA